MKKTIKLQVEISVSFEEYDTAKGNRKAYKEIEKNILSFLRSEIGCVPMNVEGGIEDATKPAKIKLLNSYKG